jgi:transcriptional regulator with XRE-family HTH domain
MKPSYPELGITLHDLRSQSGLTQKEVLKEMGYKIDDRAWRRYEAGQSCPHKQVLLSALVKAYKLTDAIRVSRVLRMAGYMLTAQDISEYGLSTAKPEPQETRWRPNWGGGGPGIYIANSATVDFIPWSKALKAELETELLSQLGRHIPPDCHLELGDYKGRRNWLILIIGPDEKRMGYIWLGSDPDNEWKYDGLVRAGDDEYVVWQVFQRYSDGTYHRIRTQPPRARTQSS